MLSVDYKLLSDVLVYAKVARGFHGGGQQLRATGTNIANYDAYAPETVTEYELGFKSDLFDRRLRLNVAAFYDDFTDAQRSVTILVNGVSTTLVTNAAKAQLMGVEVESVLRVSDAFSIAGTGGYLGSKYTEFQDVSGDRTSEPFPAPTWTGTIGGRLHTPTSFGMLRGSLSYTWQSEQNIQPQARLRDQQTQPAYGLVSGSLALSFDRAQASVEIFGKNLLQQEYNASFVTLESLGMNIRQAGEPRTWGIRLTKHLGGEGR